MRQRSIQSEERALADPFKAVTTNDEVQKDLYHLRSTGVSTEPVRDAALSLLDSLSPAQREKTQFPVADPVWRK